MKICRFDDNRIGIVRDGMVHDVTEALDVLPAYRYPFPLADQLIANLDTLRGPMEALADKAEGKPVAEVKFLSPVANPTKIIGTLDTRKAQADVARATVDLAQRDLDNTTVRAPFDGKIVFTGPFRGYGRILIIEHGEGYHTLLAGFSRIDVVPDQWLLAGEPVGILGRPESGNPSLYMELRSNGRPINPLPWLAARN